MGRNQCIYCGNCVEVPGSGMKANNRELQPYCFYCVTDAFATGARKIGHKVDWTGRTPSWCPVEAARKEKTAG